MTPARREAGQPRDAATGSLRREPELVSGFWRAGQALQRLQIAQARASGLGMLEFLVLALAAEGDGITPGEIGRLLDLRTSTMSGLVNRLEHDGLVRRRPHPTDGRLLLLRATPKGRKVYESMVAPVLVSVAEEATGMEAGESRAAARFLDRATAVVNEHADLLQRSPHPTPHRAAMPRRRRSPQRG